MADTCHIMVNNLKPDSVGSKVLMEDDEILMIDNVIVGPFSKGDASASVKTPVTVISQAGQSFEIVVARSGVKRRTTKQFANRTALVKVKMVIKYFLHDFNFLSM